MYALNVFLIGTAHKQDEQYNLLKVLHGLVDAVDVETSSQFKLKKPVPTSHGGDFKIIFDGVAKLDMPPQAGSKMMTITNSTESLADALSNAKGKIDVLNIIGHSRGAINTLMVANRLHLKVKRCNMILVDPVKRAKVDNEADATTAPGILGDCILIAMEDDAEAFHLLTTDGPAFRLEHVTRKPGHGSPISYIRLPGTHGTATQCNPETPNGSIVTDYDVDALLTKTIWPIGSVALLTCLFQLTQWGTKLRENVGIGNAQAIRKKLISEYGRIVLKNPLRNAKNGSLRPGDPPIAVGGERLVNDADPGKPDAIQKLEWKKGLRTGTSFTRAGIPDNIFRGSKVFVNDHHVTLFETEYNLSPPLKTQLRKATAFEGSMDLLTDASQQQEQAIRAELNVLRNREPGAYGYLRACNVLLNGNPLEAKKLLLLDD